MQKWSRKQRRKNPLFEFVVNFWVVNAIKNAIANRIWNVMHFVFDRESFIVIWFEKICVADGIIDIPFIIWYVCVCVFFCCLSHLILIEMLDCNLRPSKRWPLRSMKLANDDWIIWQMGKYENVFFSFRNYWVMQHLFFVRIEITIFIRHIYHMTISHEFFDYMFFHFSVVLVCFSPVGAFQ